MPLRKKSRKYKSVNLLVWYKPFIPRPQSPKPYFDKKYPDPSSLRLTSVMRNLFLSCWTSITPPFSLCLLNKWDISSCHLLNSALGSKVNTCSSEETSPVKRSSPHSMSSRQTGQGTYRTNTKKHWMLNVSSLTLLSISHMSGKRRCLLVFY